jgi:uncharacterized protein YbjQ (UPF0145 family)
VQNVGVARGIIVFAQHRRLIGASLQTLFGGNITLYTQLCERACRWLRPMVEHAEQSGANAIIGVRYDANETLASPRCHHGTAARVEASWRVRWRAVVATG